MLALLHRLSLLKKGMKSLVREASLLVMSFYFVVCHGMVILFCLKFLDFPEVKTNLFRTVTYDTHMQILF